jgi:hypothetical protein
VLFIEQKFRDSSLDSPVINLERQGDNRMGSCLYLVSPPPGAKCTGDEVSMSPLFAVNSVDSFGDSGAMNAAQVVYKGVGWVVRSL